MQDGNEYSDRSDPSTAPWEDTTNVHNLTNPPFWEPGTPNAGGAGAAQSKKLSEWDQPAFGPLVTNGNGTLATGTATADFLVYVAVHTKEAFSTGTPASDATKFFELATLQWHVDMGGNVAGNVYTPTAAQSMIGDATLTIVNTPTLLPGTFGDKPGNYYLNNDGWH